MHMMFPMLHGATGLVAAGSRDSCVYVWRRRKPSAGDEDRQMRMNTMYTLDGHKVREYIHVCGGREGERKRRRGRERERERDFIIPH